MTIVISLEQTLWQRQPDAAPPTEIAFETIGWIVSNGEQQPVLVNDSPEWTVDGHYAGLLSIGDDGWTPLADDTVATIGTDGKIDIPAPFTNGANPGPALVFSAGKTPSEVAAALAQVAPPRLIRPGSTGR